MTTSIHQPAFFPWLGLLDKIAKSTVFVFLNDVPANKASNQYRNLFYCGGEAKYLSLPVDYQLGKRIVDFQFKNSGWKDDHLNKLKNYYGKAPYFDEVFPRILDHYLQNHMITPYEFVKKTMLLMFDLFEIKVKTIESSDLHCEETKGNLVFEICRRTETKIYLSGRGAMNYMPVDLLEKFNANGITIQWHNFVHPIYSQNPKFAFVEGLSAIDILFFKGVEDAKSIFWHNVIKSYND
jgi:hypothetical protein